MRYLLIVPLLLLVGACSSTPEPIRDAPVDTPGLAEVSSHPEQFAGTPLRWGGVIAKVINAAESSHLEIVSRRLMRNGEPRQEDLSEGRFIAIVPGFLDPAIYSPGRRITVSGEFIDTIERPLGEMPYLYPQVAVSAYYLWPEWRNAPYADPYRSHPWYPYGYPYWPMRDPFWSPYWHPYPW